MSSDDNIGKGDTHDPNHYTSHQHNRPEGGWIEERITKLEHYQDRLKDELNQTNCRACNDYMIASMRVEITIPFCDECLKNIGELKLIKDHWCFKE